jgi:pimeloyl-ACP methyl ester carboxylesterase
MRSSVISGVQYTDHRLPVTGYLWTVLFLLFALLSSSAQSIQPINSSEAIGVGGIKQWISIKGSDTNHPVLLFLHGGPGNSAMGYAEKFTTELQKHFVVIQWDQRESGKTAEINTTNYPLTVSLMESDALEMIHYLRKRFSQDKIYLMGHSWGGFLGLKVAADHPELLKGYFAISPMVDQIKSEQLSLEWMINKAKESNNLQALADLAKVKVPFQNSEQLYFHRSWLAQLNGNKPPARGFVEGWGKKWLTLFNEASEVSFFDYAPQLKCSIYFFIGGKDYQTHFKLTEDYYNMLKADKKRLFWFKDSGHNLNLTEPKRLQQIIISEMDK